MVKSCVDVSCACSLTLFRSMWLQVLQKSFGADSGVPNVVLSFLKTPNSLERCSNMM